MSCPCGSGSSYPSCCEPFHDGAPAPTAEALMRSRYAAYALGRLDHVFRTWHPRTRPDEVEPTPGLTWQGLRVLRTEGGGEDDDTGIVEFEARYRVGAGAGAGAGSWGRSGGRGRDGVLHEVSRFARRAGRWVYVDGDVD